MFELEIHHCEPGGQARVGVLHTPHGPVRTPAFMPIGTRGSVKGLWPEQVRDSGADIILANTYHLALRPGAELIEQLGGLHRFIGWDGPILTDSGGYQVFSLAELNHITDDGVTFRSHIDGQWLHLDPVSATRIQNQLGADIIMAFDECPPGNAGREAVAQAVDRTVRWAAGCKQAHERDDQALFGIVQGGVFHDLRRLCADRLIDLDFDGYAIGGLSVGETHRNMVEVLNEVAPHLPPNKPRYLMGVGTPRDIVAAVRAGVDMFDCVLPTRNGRNGYAFTATHPLRLRNEKHRAENLPLEAECPCPTCRRFSRAYIRHLFLAGEMMGPILLSLHNLWFFQRFMARLRDLIPSGDWETLLAEFPVAADGGLSRIDDKGACE
ncbi:MAG TPA: tRNA guanosine(34) transglycosylase Tgt [Phycisphaerae bacterium]|nr:tRNA guanosine(34) transglycosylase Tgt [Phycisphaerae bacterium]HRR86391.1 tRNA guanosine(34) transglycosylase Tgt [Phycisphaerae bacterium]